jgi:hypothetical protein
MIEILRNYFWLYFLYIQQNNRYNITEDTITYNKICFNPYKGEVYLHLRLRKDYQSNKLFDNYNNKILYQVNMVFYDVSTKRKKTIKFEKILTFINKGSHYELKLKFNKYWADMFINEYRLPYERVIY